MIIYRITIALIASTFLVCSGSLAIAQLPGQIGAQGNQTAPPSLVQNVQPSFRIDPIVHRFTGRRGEVVPFEFTITSLGKPMNLKVAPVNLRQEETGVILHDESSEPSDAVKLKTPNEFRLKPGEAKLIRGTVTVPIAKTNYLSFGILVQDRGQDPKFEQIDGEPTKTQAGIRFVTQYVLRVDLETGNADPRAFGDLRLQKGTILSRQGLPVVRTYLDNPTDYAFECQVRARIESPTSRKPRPFFLNMHSRAELDGDDRYLVRIMPKSRLRLESAVDFPLFNGPQTLRIGVSNGRREVVGADFAATVEPGTFPALDAQYAYVGEHITISPGQIEVGTSRGASRMLGMKILNSSPYDQIISLSAKTFTGSDLEGLKISPSSFTLAAGKTKNIRVQARSIGDLAEDGLGEILVDARSEEGEQVQRRLPLIVRHTDREMPNLSLSEIKLVSYGVRPAFQLNVKNEGTSYVPLSADLQIADERGKAIRMTAGYGKWLRPGEESELRFIPDTELSGGEYLLSLSVKTHDNLPPQTKSFAIQLKTQTPETSRKSDLNRLKLK